VAATGQPRPPASGNQFYVTHCTTADSVLNAPGYSVRAASVVGDPDTLRLALEFPPYELPLDMWRDKPPRALTPRRLARVRHPVSGIWAAHSVYLEKDTMNRDRSCFTHLIQLPATVGAAAVLESWAADAWVTDYPPGATRTLPRATLPVGTAVSPAALTAFLTGPATGPTDLSVVVCPRDYRSSAEARRRLVCRFLKAVVLLAAARQDRHGRRDRLFVHAEPGLVAMLTYAAVRILPPSFTADLTFSTFEPAHRGLRDYRLATVIGTYLGGSGKGLDPDLTSHRGYGLDTFYPDRSSPELREDTDLPPGLEELVDLAGGGEWDLLAEVHRLWTAEADGNLGRVRGTIPLARAVDRLTRGGLTSQDLITLKNDRRGSSLLQARADKVWGYLRQAVLADRSLRAAFRDWLADPARLSEYRRQATEALARGDPATWDACWELVRDTADPAEVKAQVEKALKSLDESQVALSRPARDRLRAACAQAGVWPDHDLLVPTDPEELEALLDPALPPDWQGYTCFAVLGPEAKNWLPDSTRPHRPALRERVRRHLLAAPPAVLAGYARQVKPFAASEPAFLAELFRPFRSECVEFLGRLIDAAAETIEPSDWFNLLDELDVYTAPHWQGFLLRDDHLCKLLAAFKADPLAPRVWDWALGQLTPQLFQGDDWELGIYQQLDRARAALGAGGIRLKAVIGDDGLAKLNAADTVLAVIADPAATPLRPGELLEAFRRFQLDPTEGLRLLYARGQFDRVDLVREPARLDPFLAAFASCFPVTNESTARTAVTQWLAISEACPQPFRAAFQYYFVRQCVPVEYHRQLLEDVRRFPFLPEAQAWIHQGLALTLTRRAGTEAYAPVFAPTAPVAAIGPVTPAVTPLVPVAPAVTPAVPVAPAVTPAVPVVEDDIDFASSATRKARRDGRGRRKPGRRRDSQGGFGVVVVVVLLGLVVLAGSGWAIWKFSRHDKTPALPDTPPPAEKVDAKGKDAKGKDAKGKDAKTRDARPKNITGD